MNLYTFVLGFILGLITTQHLITCLLLLISRNSWIYRGFFLGVCYMNLFALRAQQIQKGLFYKKIEHINSESVYVVNGNSINKLKLSPQLKTRQSNILEKIKEGDWIKYYAIVSPSGYGQIKKIYFFKKGSAGFVQRLRIYIINQIHKSKHSNFLKSILIGDRSEFSKDQLDRLKLGGFFHLIAISGLHVGIVMYFFYRIFRKIFALNFYINYNTDTYVLSALISIILGFMYIKISLYSLSSMRAFIMTSIGILFHRRLRSSVVFLLILLGFLLYNPFWVFDLGFQLSFLCTWLLIHKRSMLFLNIVSSMILGHINLISLITGIVIIPLFSYVLMGSFFCLLCPFLFTFWDYFLNVFFFAISITNYVISIGLSDLSKLFMFAAALFSLQHKTEFFFFLAIGSLLILDRIFV